MRRSPDHVFQFMMAELGTEGSIDGNKRLVIRGKFVPKYIESLLRKYILEYVSCHMCRCFEKTNLTKDSVSRLYFLHCILCFIGRFKVSFRIVVPRRNETLYAPIRVRERTPIVSFFLETWPMWGYAHGAGVPPKYI